MTHSAYGTAGERPLRRDARENRDRILAAAREAFAELGMEASVEEIAARAGVGVGTLYRRFPTKDALAEAVFEAHLDRVAEAAASALEAADPWEGLLGYLTHVVGLQAADRGLSEIIGAHLRTEQLLGRARTRLRPLVEELIARAQAAGDLRARRHLRGRLRAPLDDGPRRRRDAGHRAGVLAALPRAPRRRPAAGQRDAAAAAHRSRGAEHAAAMRAFTAHRRREA